MCKCTCYASRQVEANKLVYLRLAIVQGGYKPAWLMPPPSSSSSSSRNNSKSADLSAGCCSTSRKLLYTAYFDRALFTTGYHCVIRFY